MTKKAKKELDYYDSNGIQSGNLPNLTQIGNNVLLPFLDNDGNLRRVRLSGTDFEVDGQPPYTRTRVRLKGTLLFDNTFHQLSDVKPDGQSSEFTFCQPIIKVVQGGSGADQFDAKPRTRKLFVRSLGQLTPPQV